MAAIDAVGEICPDAKIQACGYCLGGTLLAIGAAAMARADDDAAGRRHLVLRADRFHRSRRVAAVHHRRPARLPRRRDARARLSRRAARWRAPSSCCARTTLIWSRLDQVLLARPARASQRPHAMERRRDPHAGAHAQRISAQALPAQRTGRRPLRGRRTADRGQRHPRADVRRSARRPTTSRPGVRSTRIHLLTDTEITFVLTSGGHNAGVVSPPGHPGRHFAIARRGPGGHYLGPEEWLSSGRIPAGLVVAGLGRLARREERRPHPRPRDRLGGAARARPAPGRYVLEK